MRVGLLRLLGDVPSRSAHSAARLAIRVNDSVLCARSRGQLSGTRRCSMKPTHCTTALGEFLTRLRPDWNFGTVLTALNRPEVRGTAWASLVSHAIKVAEDE